MAAQTRPSLTAETRERTRRKSAARQLRREGRIPGSIFGHGEPETIHIGARELSDYLHHHTSSAIMDLRVGGRATPALIRELERDPVTGQVITIGFQRVDMKERLKTSIPLIFHGEQGLADAGLVLEHQFTELEVIGQADQLPESIMVEMTNAEVGYTVHVSDLQLPAGVEATKDPDTVVARVSEPKVSADVAAALDAEEAAHAAAAAAGTEEEKETEPGEAEEATVS